MLGVDIVQVNRIEAAVERHGQAFLDRMFTPAEQAYCEQSKMRFERYAGRFAAKEAVAKVISEGPRDFWLEIEIVNRPSGAPQVVLSDRLRAIFPHDISISISHEREYAVAVAARVTSL